MIGTTRPGNGGGKPAAAVGRAADAAASLQKGDGVRRLDLHGDLGPDLRRVWHIADDDPPCRVAAIVFLRLEAVLDQVNRPKLEQIVRAAYNTESRPLAGNKGDRLKNLSGAPSPRTCDRWLEPFQKALAKSLGGLQPVLSPDDVRRAERRFEPSPATEESDRRESGPPPEDAFPDPGFVSAFAARTWCVPTGPDGDPVPVALGPRGSWVCVFDTPARLAEYRAVTGAPWPAEIVRKGRELVGTALVRPEPAGILVNPSSRRATGAAESQALPHFLLARSITVRR
ncbi:hypothetical protein DMA12_39550 [Amycolatopsis balhimycina DSM 5908]|uniref:Uncharacterized protein n=1 Tax=Amycolatopsis balhimycina DSM 5908 TaxID=1081091 RepID=A0A428W0Q3_AMYBA|nr:hypothetical protein [Amycolatopsis balhimycina]RSM36652.1 hypothetical protein DMA12_39550 [Amycolatopsis balhimycina DSM 5908]